MYRKELRVAQNTQNILFTCSKSAKFELGLWGLICLVRLFSAESPVFDSGPGRSGLVSRGVRLA